MSIADCGLRIADRLTNGVLVVDKPAGPTSHDVVAVVRRAIGIERVGHTGTLDPLATGVLPLVIGKATRLASYLSGADKEYIARICLGATTPTYDAETEGTAAAGAAPPADASAVSDALPAFLGTYEQQPPPFSAKKIAGVPAYKLARQRKPVDVKPVQVTVHDLELIRYSTGVADLRIVCSSGFYVRSLAHDLGQRLGCGAYLQTLQRSRVGDFTLERAKPLADVLAAGTAARKWILPMERLLTHLSAVTLTDEGARRASHGNSLRTWDLSSTREALGQDRLRLLDPTGALVGIGEPREGGLLHPVVILV
jgi:tRNA pseudouridine55 synthase